MYVSIKMVTMNDIDHMPFHTNGVGTLINGIIFINKTFKECYCC